MGLRSIASTHGMASRLRWSVFLSRISTGARHFSSCLVLLAIPELRIGEATELHLFHDPCAGYRGCAWRRLRADAGLIFGEQCSSLDAGGALDAYITGNVASKI